MNPGSAQKVLGRFKREMNEVKVPGVSHGLQCVIADYCSTLQHNQVY